MSMLLMVKVMGIKVGNPLRKLVLLKLADNANDQGECWPSYRHISDQCEISRRSAMNHIKELERAGFLRREYRKGEKGNRSNIFHISIPSESPALGGGESPALGGESPALGGGESPALGGESPALGGGESPAPRTSHSLEPVKEPVSLSVSDKSKTKYSDRDYACAEWMNSLVDQSFEDRSVKRGKHADLKKWANTIRIMRERDNLDYKAIAKVFKWCMNDSFWCSNVLSPEKLRKKWDELSMKAAQHDTNQPKANEKPDYMSGWGSEAYDKCDQGILDSDFIEGELDD